MVKETFRKLVQVGRVIYINEGPYKGRLAAIVDIIDTNKALIDGPCTNVPRQGFKFSEMYLTRYLLKINRSQRSKNLRAVWKDDNICQRFAASGWNKNLKKDELRSNMTDYDQYKLGRARQSRNKILNRVHFTMKKNHLKTQRTLLAKKKAKARAKKSVKK